MYGLKKSALFGTLLTAVALIGTGCLERTEKITVANDGSAVIEVSFKGDAQVLEGPQAFPSAPEWTILESSIDSSTDQPQLTLRAAREVPYGSPLPESFANKESADYELDLQFPSTITVRHQGNLTYYEFRRTYKAMRFSAFELTEIPMLWDADLEERVVDSGLLNVSESDRDQYLDQFTTALGYRFWRMNRELLVRLVLNELLKPADLDTIAARAFTHFERTVTPEFLLAVMQEHDETIALTIDSLEQAMGDYFQSALVTAVGSADSIVVRQFNQERARVKKEYRFAEITGAQEFTVELQLPGTVLTTNGILEHDEPGKVAWFFKGDKLHDADIPLYALSVVTR